MLQGLSIAAVVMLCLNLWTIQGPTMYNGGRRMPSLRTERRRTLVLVGAAIGIVLAVGGMYELLIPFLVLLGFDHSAGRRRDHGGLLVPPSRAIPVACRRPPSALQPAGLRVCHRRRTRLYLAVDRADRRHRGVRRRLHRAAQIARAFTREPSVQGE